MFEEKIRLKYSMIRIIAGHLRSRQLKAPDPLLTRPTKDRVREGIFSAIQPLIKEAFVVDLYTGSGAMGIEALSRGAHFAWLNDLDKKVFAIVHENVFSLNLETQVTLTNMDAFACLKKIHHEGRKIDMLFLDPPYQRQMIDDMLIYVTEHKLLSSRGIVIIESDKKWDLTPYPFSKVKHYSYGVSIVSIGWTS